MQTKMKHKDFCIFILSNRRPDKIHTLKSLAKAGYTGPVFIIVDNEDPEVEKYKQMYGDKCVIFNKAAYAGTFDIGDNFDHHRGVIYARNACFDIAKELGFKYFMELDDDYTHFSYKFDTTYKYYERMMHKMNDVLDALLDFYISIPAKTVCIAQNGDFIGGKESEMASLKLRRKAMNTFICSTERRFDFVGRINEDVNAYVSNGVKGDLFFTVCNVSLSQVTTQQNTGGMTELYLDTGTYVKSFYSVLYQPSSVKVSAMGDKHMRLHHSITWKNTVPKILSPDVKKAKAQPVQQPAELASNIDPTLVGNII